MCPSFRAADLSIVIFLASAVGFLVNVSNSAVTQPLLTQSYISYGIIGRNTSHGNYHFSRLLEPFNKCDLLG